MCFPFLRLQERQVECCGGGSTRSKSQLSGIRTWTPKSRGKRGSAASICFKLGSLIDGAASGSRFQNVSPVMADQQRALPNAPFPAPPPFWKHFTQENIAKLKAIEDSTEGSEHLKAALPLELKYLRPPTPPAEYYTVFGEEQTVCLSAIQNATSK